MNDPATDPLPGTRSTALLAALVPHLARLADAHTFEPAIAELSGIEPDHLHAVLTRVCDDVRPASQLADIMDDPVDRVQRYSDVQRITLTFGMLMGMHLADAITAYDQNAGAQR